MDYTYKQLSHEDLPHFRDLMQLFGDVFEKDETYQGALPGDTYIQKFLDNDAHLVLIALDQNIVVGGLVSYVLKKFEQERSEIFVYDFAVAADHQRRGIGTTLINNLKRVAEERGIRVIFVQAEKKDKGAIAFYQKLRGLHQETVNFDIPVSQ